jgi:ribosome biogenesis GTPase
MTGEVRAADGKGRHTTTARYLIPLPHGGALIDTPGLRSFALYEAAGGVAEAFADIESVGERCRFRDCGHTSEPGCAVLAAIEAETLDASRLEAHRALEREVAHELIKVDKQAAAEAKAENRRFSRSIRSAAKKRRRMKEGG